jgi:DNA-binding ferritin-like protein
MENKDLQQYIADVQHFSNALKFFHWQTKIYAKHIALGDLFGDITDLVDEFTETAMGKYGRIDVEGLSYDFVNISDKNVITAIDDMIEKAINLTDVLDTRKDTDLLNLRDELMGKCNRTKYLLTLK